MSIAIFDPVQINNALIKFIELTINSYGSDIIKQLKNSYKSN